MISHYLKMAVRSLLKNKSYHLISALCLAVGIACFSYVWLFVSAVNAQKRLPDYERRLSLYVFTGDGRRQSRYTGNELLRLEEELGRMGVEGLAVASPPSRGEVLLTDADGREMPYIVQLIYANPYYFDYWGMSVVQGRLKDPDPFDVALSASFAKRVFGEENPVGKTLRFVDDASSRGFRVAAVVDSDRIGVQGADCFFSCLVNLDVPQYPFASCFLPQGMDWKDFEESLKRVGWQRGNETASVSSYMLNSQDGQERIAQLLLLCIGGLILFSAMINYLKYVIQMFYSRQRELVLRKCMGSGSGGLYGLLASEIFLMITIALFLSLVLTECVFAVLADGWLGNFPAIPVGSVYLIQCGVFAGLMAVGGVAACFPVLRLWRRSLQGALQATHRKHTFRNLMIGVQLAISMFFVGGLLIIHQTWDATLFNVYAPLSGAEEERIVVLPVNSQYLGRNIPPILSKIEQMSEVKEVTRLASYSPSDYSFMDYECKDGSRQLLFGQSGTSDYFRFFQIPLQGKEVPADAEGQVYVSRSFKEWLDRENNAGSVRLNGKDYQIAGVYDALYAEPQGEEMYIGSVYFPSPKALSYYIKVSESTSVQAFQEQLTALCRTFVPETLPLDIHLLPDDDNNRDVMRQVGWVLAGLGGISLLLVTLSVYSSVSLDTLDRRKEVAIRKINGASYGHIFFLFAKVYIRLSVVAYLLVCPLLFLAADSALGGAYRVVSDWQWAFWLFLILLLLLAAVTIQKIVQTMRINPADVIRKE